MDPTHANPATAGAGAPASRLAAGTVLGGRFTIELLLESGPTGEVYRAAQDSQAGGAVVHLLPRELGKDALVRARLKQDLAAASQLSQRNIAAGYGLGIDGELVYFAGEFVDGPSLRQMLQKKRGEGRAFSLKGACNVATHLCNALEYLHGSLIHGLLSLDTVRVNSAGRVKITQVGLARGLIPDARFRATLGAATASLAPELAALTAADRRADLYAVGAILFELLVGRARARDDERVSTLAPGLPTALDAVIARCLRAAPEERFGDARELKAALHAATEAALADRARPPGAGGFAPRPPPLPTGAVGPALRPPPGAAAAKAPPPAAARPGAASDAGPAPTVVDENQPRWLVQKDKLDLGPFRMAEVRAQIQSGAIHGAHTLIDMDTGSRTTVGEHPLLRELCQKAQSVLDSQLELLRIEAERRHARRRTTTLAIVGVAAIAIAGAAAAYFLTRSPRTETRIVYRDKGGGAPGEDSWKIEVMMKVDPPVPRKKGAPHKRGGKGAGSEFDSVTNLGDATEGGGDETLDEAVVQKVMNANFGLLKGCVLDEKHRNPAMSGVDFDFIIRGTGQVSAVKANGQTASPLAGCIYGKMQAVQFPKFNGVKTHASFSLALK